MCVQFRAFFFFFDSASFELNFKLKKTKRPDKLSRRGLQRIFWIIFSNPKDEKLSLLFLLVLLVLIERGICCLIDLHAGLQNPSHHGFFLSVSLIKNELNYCCVKMRIAFAFHYFYYELAFYFLFKLEFLSQCCDLRYWRYLLSNNGSLKIISYI